MKTTTKFVVKGAHYYDRESKVILIPQFTGEFWIVDCVRYVRIEDLEERYEEAYIQSVEDDYLTYGGERYYYSEVEPEYIGEWELLSDLSELVFNEQSKEF